MEQIKKKEEDVLVVRDEKTGEISVVAGLDGKGYPKRAQAKAEHSQEFLHFDRHGDAIDNFFKNFYRQCKEPTRFGFYRVAADMVEALLLVIKDLLRDPAANAELLAPHKVDTSAYQQQSEAQIEWQMPEAEETKRENAEDVEQKVDETTEQQSEAQIEWLFQIAKNATTGGQYKAIGELYGFPVKVVSDRTLGEGLEFTDNRFVVEGNFKYTYNNGHLAMADPVAARNFLNALEKIPSVINQYKAKNEVLEQEIPQLEAIVGKEWEKENELKQLKSELAALDRKIQLELVPPTPELVEKEKDGQEIKPVTENVRNVPPKHIRMHNTM